MQSIFDELLAKLAKDPRLSKKSMARVDLGTMLFNAREDVRELWLAAEASLPGQESERLRAIVEKLRPIFGERSGR